MQHFDPHAEGFGSHRSVKGIRLPEQGLDAAPTVLVDRGDRIPGQGAIHIDLFPVGPAVTVGINLHDGGKIIVGLVEIIAIGVQPEPGVMAQYATLGVGGCILQFLATVGVKVPPITANPVKGPYLGAGNSDQTKNQTAFDQDVQFHS